MKVRDLVFDAAIIAIIVVMAFVPYVGYISVAPGVSFTLMHLPVLLGAYLFGWKRGTIYGAAFGITSLIQACLNPVGLNAFFMNPLISILPRVLFGFLSGFFFQLLSKITKLYKNPLMVGCISLGLTVIHTVLVMGTLTLLYSEQIIPLWTSTDPTITGSAFIFSVLIVIGMAGEGIIAGIIIPALGKALSFFARKEE